MPLPQNCPITLISSPQNPRYKAWLRLTDAKGIKKHGEAIMAGRKVLAEVLQQFPQRVAGLIATAEAELEHLPVPPGLPVFITTPPLFADLDIYGTKGPLLLLHAPPLPEWDETVPEGLTLFLPFQNPINLGTTLRSAAALGASVVLLQEAATPYLPKSLRASGPALFQTPVMQGPPLARLAELHHLPLFALSPKGSNIFSFAFPKAVGLVAGMEGPGLDDHWPPDKRLSIPMQPQVESLNAAIAVAMAMACLEACKYN